VSLPRRTCLLLLVSQGFFATSPAISQAQEPETYYSSPRILQEPDFRSLDDSAEVYRIFLWRSFGSPVSVRLIRHGIRYAAITKQYPNWDGDADSTMLERDSVAVVQGIADSFLERLNGLDFWHMTPPVIPPHALHLDGDTWVIEAQQHGKYHSVSWWSPPRSGPGAPFRELGEALLSLGNFHLESDVRY
jgi:hypothetical protein